MSQCKVRYLRGITGTALTRRYVEIEAASDNPIQKWILLWEFERKVSKLED